MFIGSVYPVFGSDSIWEPHIHCLCLPFLYLGEFVLPLLAARAPRPNLGLHSRANPLKGRGYCCST